MLQLCVDVDPFRAALLYRQMDRIFCEVDNARRPDFFDSSYQAWWTTAPVVAVIAVARAATAVAAVAAAKGAVVGVVVIVVGLLIVE